MSTSRRKELVAVTICSGYLQWLLYNVFVESLFESRPSGFTEDLQLLLVACESLGGSS